MELLKWFGFLLSFLFTFFLSLFHLSLSSFSKISLSRFLENKKKDYRLKILRAYDEIKISIEFSRIFFLIVFLFYLYLVFPRVGLWLLWLFLLSLAIYIILLDALARLLANLGRNKILSLMLPCYKLIHLFSTPVLLVARIKTSAGREESRETSEEEVETFIDEARSEGIIEKEEGVLLKSVVEFGDTVVREIMTPRVDMACIRKESTIGKIRELVIKEKHSRIPVYKDKIDNIEGIVIAKDLLEYSEDQFRNNSIVPLIRPVYFVPESMRVAELLKELQKRKQKLAIVVDEHGGVSGLVTMEDLMEEIVGDIRDEYDLGEAQIVEKGPQDYLVSGDAEVEKLEELFDLDIAEDDFITVGGLITHHLGRLPRQGEHIQIKGLQLEILEVDQKRIKKLRVKKSEAPRT
jgi:CBS domain containing-hemolysin-like protein